MSFGNGFSRLRRPGARTVGSESRSQSNGCGVAIMAKASVPGRAKTRLVPPLSFEEAAAFNTAFLQDIASNLIAAGRQREIAAYVAFGPSGSEQFFRDTLPGGVGLIEACLPEFGECLLHAIEQIFAYGHSAAALVNSDSPTLPTALLVEAAEVLARPGDRAVLGPSSDGGYYLLGLKQTHRRLFADIAWSTERVAEQTLARAREINLDVHVLPTWYDVDDVEALRALNAELFSPKASRLALQPYGAPRTAALIDRLGRETDLFRRIGGFMPAEELRA